MLTHCKDYATCVIFIVCSRSFNFWLKKASVSIETYQLSLYVCICVFLPENSFLSKSLPSLLLFLNKKINLMNQFQTVLKYHANANCYLKLITQKLKRLLNTILRHKTRGFYIHTYSPSKQHKQLLLFKLWTIQ